MLFRSGLCTPEQEERSWHVTLCCAFVWSEDRPGVVGWRGAVYTGSVRPGKEEEAGNNVVYALKVCVCIWEACVRLHLGVCVRGWGWVGGFLDFWQVTAALCVWDWVKGQIRGLTGTVLCVSVLNCLQSRCSPCVCDWQSSLYFANVYSCRKATWHIVKLTCNLSVFSIRYARFFMWKIVIS